MGALFDDQQVDFAAAPQPAQEPRGWVCGKCGTDRLKAPCPHGHHAALTGQCPMVGTAQGASPQPQPAKRCAQCQSQYRQGTAAGCPKCAPGVVVSEDEFRRPLAEPQPAPLTDEQRMALFVELNSPCVKADSPSEMFTIIVRAIERAHGIGGKA